MPDFRNIVRRRLAGLNLDPRAESTLAEELAQHLEDRYRELRSGGAGGEEALREAAGELADLEPIRRHLPRHDAPPVAGAASGHLFGDLARDLRFTVRGMRKNPFFVLFVVLTMALGIGANTTVFTVIHTLILNPLPVPDSTELAAVAATEVASTAKSQALTPVSLANLKDYQARNQVFGALAGYTSPRIAAAEENGTSERMFLELVTGNYFATLGIAPAAGRFFSPAEDTAPGAHPVAVMNYAKWQARFGGTPDIVGRTLRLNHVAITVIGVAPPGFIGVNGIFGPDFWIPTAMAELLLPAEMHNALSERSAAAFQGVGRLKPGVSRAQAQADLATIAAALAREYPNANAGRTAAVRPLADVIFGTNNSSMGRTPLVMGSAVLLVVVGIVLLIACSNVANLLLARSAARRQEIAVRMAMGASRARLVRQLLTESVVLGLMSGAAGAWIGYAGTQLLWSFRPAEVAANFVVPKTDATVLLYSMLISLVTGLVFGIVPALRASRTDVGEALKEEARAVGRSRRRITASNALLAGQVAFSFVALVTAALFLRSIARAYEIDPGFETQHLAIFMTNSGQVGYTRPQVRAFYKDVRQRVGELPGVASVSWASNLPLFAHLASGLEIEGREQRSRADVLTTVVNTVDAGYFRTAGIEIVQGRDFGAADLEDGSPVAIVNQKLAHDYWPAEQATGKRIRFPGEQTMRRVVGVARTANYSSLAEPAQPCVYVPLEQKYSDAMVLYVRTRGDPRNIMAAVSREVRAAAPEVQVNDARTGRKLVDQALFGARIGVTLLSLFGLMALGLASIGLYGITAYSVNLRRREIGVRMALGAGQENVLRLILKQGMSVVAAGIAIGLVVSLAVARLLARMLFGVSAADPLSLAAAAAVLLAVALAACWLPARSASRVDPLAALRQ
jgi:putative ABC transport system permease protein